MRIMPYTIYIRCNSMHMHPMHTKYRAVLINPVAKDLASPFLSAIDNPMLSSLASTANGLFTASMS